MGKSTEKCLTIRHRHPSFQCLFIKPSLPRSDINYSKFGETSFSATLEDSQVISSKTMSFSFYTPCCILYHAFCYIHSNRNNAISIIHSNRNKKFYHISDRMCKRALSRLRFHLIMANLPGAQFNFA